DLRLFRAEALAQFGRFAAAEVELDAAKPHAPPLAWHKAAAKVARLRPDLAAAADHLRAALSRDPLWPEGHRLLAALTAHAHRRGDRTADALEACRAGLRANVDNDLLVAELAHLSRGRAETRSSLRFVADQLRRQPHAGDGLVAYRDQMLALAADDDEEQ